MLEQSATWFLALVQPTDGLRSWCLFVQFVNSIIIESDWEYLDPMKVNLHVYDFFFFFLIFLI